MYNASGILGTLQPMVKQDQYYRNKFIMPGLFLVMALVIWLALMREFRLDDSFITYRYAQNASRGWGLVYNQGDVVLSTTAPLYALILALLSLVIRDFHTLGGLIGTLSIGLGGWLLVSILPARIPVWIRLVGGLLYVLSSVLWLTLGMETALWIILTLAAIRLAQIQRWGQAGLFIAAATLTRPDGALPGMLLGLAALGLSVNQYSTRDRWWLPALRYGLVAVAPIAAFGLWVWAAYGSPLPATLSAKSAQATLGITGFGPFVTTWDGLLLIAQSLLSQSSLYITFGLLALFGLSSRLTPTVVLLVAWSGAHLFAYTVLGIAPYRWYYAPLLPALIALVVCGLDTIHARLAARKIAGYRVILVGMALFPVIAQLTSLTRIAERMEHGGSSDPMLPIVDWEAYRQVGDWLRTATPQEATVGVAEVGQVGFYAERWMTDYLGLLQPEAADMLERGDLYSWLAGYAPDYLVFQRFRGAPLVLYNYLIGDDPWFRASYREGAAFDDARYSSGPVTIFERTTLDKALVPQSAQADFGGLRLVGLAADGYDLTPQGGPVRVRLDWQVVGEIPVDLHIAVKGLEMPQIPSFDGDYQTMNWRGTFSTWHGFVVPQSVPPGGYPLEVSIGPVGGPYASQVVGWLDVSYPKTGTRPDGAAFMQDGEAQLVLSQVDITMSPILTLDTAWFSEQDIARDYAYFAHVTPTGGGEPIAQADGRPLDGTYPTFLWQRGELVPLHIELGDVPAIVGEYDVYIGWYSPSNGERLLQADGSDQLLVARLVVSPEGGAIIVPISD